MSEASPPSQPSVATEYPSGGGRSSPVDVGAMALPVGTRLAEFEVRRVLGSGGFGIVYLAWDHALERDVALKEYLPGTLAGRGEGLSVALRSQSMAHTFALGLKSFVNEARLLARFDHPSLVKVYRFWEANGTAYMVMPLYRGNTLRQLRSGMLAPPTESGCRKVLEALLSAIDVLHKEGVYHRDIAPDNILIGDDGVPVLLDFGAARRVIGEGTQALTSIIKPHFAPLEQYADKTAMRQGAWTDLYALGGTIFYLLTGNEPAPAASRALYDDQPLLADAPPEGCSRDFAAAIDWMLSLRPADRPQSVTMFRDVLYGRRPMPPPAAREAITQPGVPAHHAPQVARGADGSEPTLILGSHHSQPVAPDAVGAPTAAVRSGLGMSRRRLVLVLAVLLVFNALAWWWTFRAQRAEPSRAPDLAAETADAPSERQTPPREPRAEKETVVSVMPARAPKPAASAVVSGASAVTVARSVPAAASAPVRAADTRAASSAAAAVAAIAEPPAGPRAACSDRMLLSFLLCVKRECEQASWRNHPDCVQMREQEEAHRRRDGS